MLTKAMLNAGEGGDFNGGTRNEPL